ncbi:MAG: hypothetical protein FGM15_01940 [Chthoniobacterales bacterium]|nr:hypothetical protein [Chthoniobacterales bacterium]
MTTKPKPSGLHRSLLLATLLLATASSPGWAQSNLVRWGVYDTGGQASAATNYAATGVAATPLTLGYGISPVNVLNTLAANSFGASSASMALLNGDYFQFTVSPAANYSLSFSALDSIFYRTTNGRTSAGWYWNRDNYATALASTDSVSTNAGGAPLNVTFASNAATTMTTFRAAAWGDGWNQGATAISATGGTNQNPSLSGTATLRAASTLTWIGDLFTGNWNDYESTNAYGNWNGNNTPMNGDTLVFAGAWMTNTTNSSSSLQLKSIIFTNTAGNFSISGNAMTVSNGIVNLSANGQTFSNQVTLGAAQTFDASAGELTFAGAINNNGNQLTISGSNNTTVSGAMSGAGGLTKTGDGELSLAASNSFSGGTLLNGGTLTAGHASAFGSGSVTLASGTTLDLANFSIANALIINGGTLTNAGTVSGAQFNAGTTTLSSANSTVASVTSTATLNVAGNNTTITNVSGGTVNVTGANTAVKSYTGGNINISNATVVTVQSGNSSGAISGAGSLAKNSAGTLTLSGTSTYSGATTVSGGTMVVNGAVNSSIFTVESGATLGGSGSIGGLIVGSGGTISPGNSPGTQTIAGNATWDGGGNYNWQIHDATGAAGSSTGWDLINITGALDLTGLSDTNKFNINLWSLSGVSPDTNGNAVNFTAPTNKLTTYTWTILNAAGGINGFNSTNFNLNVAAFNGTGGFLNPLGEGSFYLVQNGNNLDLKFGIIPEPGTWAAAAMLLGGAGFVRWRRSKKA